MCRAEVDGGRRCPSNRGARKRAYERARYAVRTAQRAATSTAGAAHSPDDTASETADIAALRTRTADAWEALRADPGPAASLHYEQTVRDLGQAVADDAAQRYQQLAANDDTITAGATADLDELQRAKSAADERIQALYGIPPDAPERVAALEEFNAAADALFAAKKAQHEAAKRRQQLRWQSYQQTLEESGITFANTTINRTKGGRLTKADTALMEQVAGRYPDAMMTRAESGGLPVAVKRSKRRAHYAAINYAPTRQQAVICPRIDRDAAGNLVVNPWGRFSSVDVEKSWEGNPFDQYDYTVPAAGENRAELSAVVEEFNATARGNPISIRTATINGEERLYLTFKKTRTVSGRSSTPTAELTFSDESSMTHEFGHRVEYANPHISVACKTFLARRTEGCAAERYHRKEMTKPDSFVTRYIGKDYPGTPHTEIFSMGMESLATGHCGGLVGDAGPWAETTTADLEHRNLILGLLASDHLANGT